MQTARQNQRRALSHVGGEVRVEARDPELAKLLTRALDVSTSESGLAHVHGFHSYPARLHPDTASALIAGASRPGDSVLDPFCGSGTVVVEARALGRRAFGSDLNPLAVLLTRLKSQSVSPAFTERLVQAAENVAAFALERKEAKLGPSEKYGPEDRALFPVHVLLELDGLRLGIEKIEEPELRNTLRLVHSALLTKLSRKTGDSSEREQPKRIAAGFAIRFFVMKTEELARRELEFSGRVPERTPRARVEVADARRLEFLRGASIDCVVSSPPYPGVYDYYAHHRVRLRWLRLDGTRFAREELASRRSAGSAEKRPAGLYLDAFRRDFSRCLGELRRVLVSGGRAFLVVGDSVFGGRALYANEWLLPLAERAGLTLIGRAAQERPHFHGPSEPSRHAPRKEHLFALEKVRS